MHISRRSLLAAAGASLLMPGRVAPPATAAETIEGKWLSAAKTGDSYAAVGITKDFAARLLATSAVRLHAVEAAPHGHLAVAVARRPGAVALVIDRRTASMVGQFAPEPGRVFSGHGRFTSDGRRFIVAEIDRDTGAGIVTVRDTARGFAIVDAWATAGDGPHDLIQFGGTLVVANGGVEPGSPEAATAKSAHASLALLDMASGAIKQSLALPRDLQGQSLRHLAVGAAGAVVVAARELAPEGASRPLLYRAAGDALVPYEADDAVLAGFKGYVGSVAVDSSGAYVAAASPRGGCVAAWDIGGRFLGSVRSIDGCGLAAAGEAGQFVATSGLGEVLMLAASADGFAVASRTRRNVQFDNHIRP